MGEYKVNLTDLAKKQLKQHQKAGNRATIHKIETILQELSEHPFTGTGKPEALKHDRILVQKNQSKGSNGV